MSHVRLSGKANSFGVGLTLSLATSTLCACLRYRSVDKENMSVVSPYANKVGNVADALQYRHRHQILFSQH